MTQKTFKQAYDVLQAHAERLRNQQEPNIDDLLTVVTESVAAYTICKERIDAVEMALEQALNGAEVAGRTMDDVPTMFSSPKHPALDDDIPF